MGWRAPGRVARSTSSGPRAFAPRLADGFEGDRRARRDGARISLRSGSSCAPVRSSLVGCVPRLGIWPPVGTGRSRMMFSACPHAVRTIDRERASRRKCRSRGRERIQPGRGTRQSPPARDDGTDERTAGDEVYVAVGGYEIGLLPFRPDRMTGARLVRVDCIKSPNGTGGMQVADDGTGELRLRTVETHVGLRAYVHQ